LPGDRRLLLAGAALSVVAFAVTAAYQVPRNNQLATLAPGTPEAAAYWQTYLGEWTRMNHVRVALLLASGVSLWLGARRG